MDDEKLKYQIGSNIAAYRKRAGMTQAGLAEKLNYSDKAISKWENNKCEPDLSALRNIANAFGVTVEELFDGDCAIQIQLIDIESQPALHFIGKRYNGSESIRAKWKMWKENGWFSFLESLDEHYGHGYIGAKRIVNGGLEYWIGMFFPLNTNAPEGFDQIDVDEVNLAVFRLNGKAHKVTTFETHNLCLDEMCKRGMTRFEDHWCFECFGNDSIDSIGTDKIITIDYKITIM